MHGAGGLAGSSAWVEALGGLVLVRQDVWWALRTLISPVGGALCVGAGTSWLRFAEGRPHWRGGILLAWGRLAWRELGFPGWSRGIWAVAVIRACVCAAGSLGEADG